MPSDHRDNLGAFEQAIEALSRITEHIFDLRVLVPPSDAVLAAIEADPNNRAVHVRTICSLMRPDYPGPWEALSYLMYRLRWPEIRRHAELCLKDERNRMARGEPSEKAVDRWMEDIIAADNDYWEERHSFLGRDSAAR
jgi:hypothetical protein